MTPAQSSLAAIGAIVAALLFAAPAAAQQISIDLGDGNTMTARIIQLIALITVLCSRRRS